MNHAVTDETTAKDQSVITIKTLGCFDVEKNRQSLVEASPGSRKLWELFKFMLTHRQRSFTPEALLDGLWASEDYNDPRSTLRRQMHRLRQILEENENSQTSYMSIVYVNGYYRWNPEMDARVDADIFESSVQLGEALQHEHPEKALLHYQKALSMYHGDYLPECTDQQWVFPVRSHYRRQYLKAVLSSTGLLMELGQFAEVLRVCEKAIELDIYEEEFHLRLMESLLQLGERKQALTHYEYITGFYYQELGLKPTPALKSLYKRMLSTQPTLDSMDALHADLDGIDPLENAYFCNPDVFRSIYELERRRSERSGAQAVVGMVTMSHPSSASHGKQQQRMQALQQHLLHHLRKGDTVTRWNDSQFLVLLPGLNTETMEAVLQRVIQKFPRENPDDLTRIKTHCHLILPPAQLPPGDFAAATPSSFAE
ncbi:AfsR/SARP family transcriptional regulator [Anoxynatronum sibiricum]|uniref:BTAD domain-containing putative transcriptional regulator n=1 Tax=Anoxynatronum sibiricum TaxID=210623 RepID=A0ABU9VWN6_9CLOT